MNALIRDTIRARPRGAAAQLARDLGVDPSTVTRWTQDAVPESDRWSEIELSLALPMGSIAKAYAESVKQLGLDGDMKRLVEEIGLLGAEIDSLRGRIQALEDQRAQSASPPQPALQPPVRSSPGKSAPQP